MKKVSLIIRLVLVLPLFIPACATAQLFTTNMAIGALDHSHDGADIIISNCTVTVDGPHAFNSLRVASGGVLTHSFISNGTTTFSNNVTESVGLSGTNPVTLLNPNVSGVVVTDTGSVVTYTNGVDFVLTSQADGTTQIYRTSASSIPDGATVLVAYSWSYTVNAGLNLIVTNDVTVAAGGSINANGLGYGPASGPGQGYPSSGAFADGSGAGHGGLGGLSLSNAVGGSAYGSVAQPVTLGSSGGAGYAGGGGNGGGAIQIVAGGTVTMDGLVSANGTEATNSRAGGGAGGSIWITATNLAGAGRFVANGGAGEPIRGGGGGGGRISIQCATNGFSGSFAAFGGTGAQAGGAGTVLTQVAGQRNFLLLDNGGRAGAGSPIALPPLTDVLIRSNAWVLPVGSWAAGNVTVATNGTLTTTSNAPTVLILNVNGTLAVQPGGQIMADSLGYPAGGGYGAGHSYYDSANNPCSGGGYGGSGAVSLAGNVTAGATYGLPTSPTSYGSGGGSYLPGSPGGNGGGAIQIAVLGAAQIDGRVSANGGNGSGSGGGGGSGGSVYLTATSVTGAGLISANGGNGAGVIGGGGGGGRIAIISSTYNFSGNLNAAAGGGANWGGAGTIYWQQSNYQTNQLILDNGGHLGTNTPLPSLSSANLVVRNGAIAASSYATFASLNIGSNAWLASLNSTCTLVINGHVIIQSGGGITADFVGYSSGSAGGYYGSFPYAGGGGGHGGAGGNATGNLALGGGASESSVTSPSLSGGGGGNNYFFGIGGGGGLQLTVAGTLQLDGTISANGGSGMGVGGGGSAGGSINLHLGTLAGGGTIAANGGSGAASIGGGGGGGCIAVTFDNNSFGGNITAYGGSGANYGGAGTIYLKTNSASHGSLIVDNAGHPGANSVLPSSATEDLTLRGGGLIYASSSSLLGNLVIGSNAWLVVSNVYSPPATLSLTVSGDITVQPGGGIIADGTGYHAGTGYSSGAGTYYSASPYYPGSGGGHGGYGGSSYTNSAPNGGVGGYDSFNAPNYAGSGGGGYSPYSIGGPGGGVLQLMVGGNLQVDGTITANGGNGSGAGGGGGAGGTLNLSVGGLAGKGVISANGGSGGASFGGGGGGGNIAVACSSNSFSGSLSACGGGGANYGGAGLIYFSNTTALIADNGGHLGTNTPLPSASGTTLNLRNGAIGTLIGSPAFAALNIGSNAWLASSGPSGSGLYLNINGDAIVQSGGGITLNSAGYAPGAGLGVGGAYSGASYACGGGGHGGAGGNPIGNLSLGGGTSESSVTSPYYAGGGGGGYASYSTGGSGGGVLQLTITGMLQLDGTLSANGGNGAGQGGGGGAGGSLNLHLGTFTGSGSITANGGSGAAAIGGGGGGGCIAAVFDTNSFGGAITAYGGAGANYGGAGTLYLKTNSASHGSFIVDNAGHAGAGSLLPSSPTADLALRNGGLIYAYGPYTLGNLVISSNAWIIVSNYSGAMMNLTVAGNATLQAGGGISADAAGYHANVGYDSGAGGYFNLSPFYPGGGGGHAGYGGSSFTNSAANGGNGGYDSFSAPNAAGSGGGGYSPFSIGGNGGGVVQLTVAGNLQVDGSLTANGGSGSGAGGGGGAGGSLNLNVGGLAGSGSISANGGSGYGSIGGGGGGGIIAVGFTSNLFSGTLSACGGAGANYGGAGLVCLKTNGSIQSLLIADNAGHRGTNTAISSVGSGLGLALRNGAILQSPPGQTFSSLLITSNAWLIPSATLSPGDMYCTVTGDALIQSGGGIAADAAGSAQNTGNGRGASSGVAPWYACSGASHGGYGGGALSNSLASGPTYDSTLNPINSGSGGGGYSTDSIGGAGGGSVYLHVYGALQLDGAISANGGNGAGAGGGGGSGGSLDLNLGTLAGAGSIMANGGNGALNGGGGGGGRIAVYFTSNAFAGNISAHGGGGANYGGAGTVCTKTNSSNYGLLVLDNAGHPGTNTSFDFNAMDLIIQGNAVGLLPSGGSWSPHNLLIRTNGVLTGPATTSSRTLNANFITIDPGGLLSLDGAGAGAGAGSGAGYATLAVRGGGGYGGYGGGNNPPGGAAYGSIQFPAGAGSGGAGYSSGLSAYGGAGGGALQIFANTITVNGRLSANGLDGGLNSGGGSGGSLNFAGVFNLAGSGTISANGGAGSGAAGGGGGGRIALVCTANNFTGQLSARGGNGLYPGGAGTIYTRVSGVRSLVVDNGGSAGTNTPLAGNFSPPTAPYDLTITGGASVVPLSPLPLFSNLTISAGSSLTVTGAPATLMLAVLNDFNLAGSLSLDDQGYAQTNGPGAGVALANAGSGGGYGGAGGASTSGAPGGTQYGSATQPVDFGSGGGNGLDTIAGGSDGGGAVRISVGGTLTVDGSLSANGNDGWQDDSGGGAGGSIWITAGTLAGAGNISAAGGDGDYFFGGGGGGGRIAVYTPANGFTGTTNASGGDGAFPGQAGSLFLTSIFNDFQVASQTPAGVVSNTVSEVVLTFNEAVNPVSLAAATFTLTTPGGEVAGLTGYLSTPNVVLVSFPEQNLLGDYSLQAPAAITNILGQALAHDYTGTFTIMIPVISGTVSDTNGLPVAGVAVNPDAGFGGATTGTNGSYAFGVPPGWSGTVTPSLGTLMFVPGALGFTNVSGSLAGQNFVMVPTVAPTLATSWSSTNLSLGWTGIPGVTYQVWCSTNLVDWLPYGVPLAGTNGAMQFSLPVDASPSVYFRMGAAN